MRVLLDNNTPAVTCCGFTYEFVDKEDTCFECGDAFDWDDICEAWNPEDYEELDGFYDENAEDDDTANGEDSEWWDGMGHQMTLQDLLKQRDGNDDYMGLPLNGGEKGWSPAPARPPTAHLRGHHRVEPKSDPFLDVSIPDEAL